MIRQTRARPSSANPPAAGRRRRRRKNESSRIMWSSDVCPLCDLVRGYCTTTHVKTWRGSGMGDFDWPWKSDNDFSNFDEKLIFPLAGIDCWRRTHALITHRHKFIFSFYCLSLSYFICTIFLLLSLQNVCTQVTRFSFATNCPHGCPTNSI